MAKKIKHTKYFWGRYGEQREAGYDHEDALSIAATIEDRHNAKARRESEQTKLTGWRPIRVTHFLDGMGGRVSYASR